MILIMIEDRNVSEPLVWVFETGLIFTTVESYCMLYPEGTSPDSCGMHSANRFSSHNWSNIRYNGGTEEKKHIKDRV